MTTHTGVIPSLAHWNRSSSNETPAASGRAAGLLGRFGRLAAAAAAFAGLAGSADAAAEVRISQQPITWNIIGLDSNDVSSGPNQFPLGVRVCNTGDEAATNVSACVTLTGGTGAAYVSLKDDPCVFVDSLAPGESADFFFTVEVVRDAAAYFKTRGYEIVVAADDPVEPQVTTGELFVEKFVSQNRNAVLSLVGPPTVVAGECRTFVLNATTAPGGYNQLTTFVNFPNTYFQVQSVTAYYTSDGDENDVDNDKVYADACGWNPVAHDCSGSLPSPGPGDCSYTFLPSTFPDSKAGGDITVVYEVCVRETPDASVHLTTLISDKSGSSYHYNDDFGKDILILEPRDTDICVLKSDSQDPVEAGEEFEYYVSVINIGESVATDVVLTDTLPLGVTFLSATPEPDSGPNPLRWELGDMEPGDVLDFTIRVRAECDGIGEVLNKAGVSAAEEETTLENNLVVESTHIEDTTPPDLVCCDDVEVTADECDNSAYADVMEPTVTDNCDEYPWIGPAVRDDGLELWDPYPIGVTHVCWTATDASGNEAECCIKVTVHPGDCEECVLQCPDDITTDSTPGKCGAYVDYDVLLTGDCPDTTVVCELSSGSFFPVGETTVTCWAVPLDSYPDFNPNPDPEPDTECSFSVTVLDREDPDIECPDDIEVSAVECETSADVHVPTPTAEDNCDSHPVIGDPVRSDGADISDPFPIGTTTVTWTVTDESGNSASCSTKVTVDEGQCPDCFVQCPADIVVNSTPDQCGAKVDYDVVVSGECRNTTVVCELPSGSFFPVGETTVTCRAIPVYGQGGSGSGTEPEPDKECSFTVKVIDRQGPDIDCPDDIVVSATLGLCGAEVDYYVQAWDECPGDVDLVCTPAPGSFFPVGATKVVCIATDASGNKTRCEFYVIVKDGISPDLICPADITVDSDPGVCTAVVDYFTTATDNCTTVQLVCEPPPGSEFPVGETEVVCTATDIHGNVSVCKFTVKVRDGGKPVLDCPGEIVVNADAGLCSADVDYVVQASDSCAGPVSLVCTPPPGSTFPVGQTLVVCKAEDAAGNKAECFFKVIVRDKEAPAIQCPADIIIKNEYDDCSAVVDYVTTATDNCTSQVRLVCTPPPGSVFEAGITTVTCTATDDAGNQAVCKFTVNVRDRQKPSIVCPANITVNTDAGLCSAKVDYVAKATDNCTSEVKLVCTPPPGSTFPVGVTPVVCVASDKGGNTATCSFLVTVRDRKAPTLICPSDIVVEAQSLCCEAVVDYVTTATDNCSGAVSVTCNPPPGSLFPVGDTTVVCVARDSAGNTAHCNFTITVRDSEAPRIFCPIDFSVPADPNCCEAIVDYVTSATDNCGDVELVCDPPPGALFPLGFNDVTCTATDAAGHVTTCTFTIEVCDHEAPVIVCPADIFTIAEGCETEASVTIPPPTATDNCTSAPVITRGVRSDNLGLNDPYPLGVTTITWAAVDGSNNTADCVTKVSVSPGQCEPCTFLCPQNIFANTAPGRDDAVVNYPAPSFSGNCSGATVVCQLPSGSTFEIGETDVVCTASVAGRLPQTCRFSVFVADNEPPQMTCAADVEVTAAQCENTAPATVGPPLVTDNATPPPTNALPVRSDGLSITDPYPVGTTTVTWTATDEAGNSSSCSTDVTVHPGSCGLPVGCTRTMEYWRSNPDAWPVESLNLGARLYTKAELIAILHESNQNRCVRLAHQLIAAKLNVADGADPTWISEVILQADNLIGSRVVPPHGTGTLRAKYTATPHISLGTYNIGTVGPGPCQQ